MKRFVSGVLLLHSGKIFFLPDGALGRSEIIIFLANSLCEYNVPHIVEGELPGDPPGTGTGKVVRSVIKFFEAEILKKK